MALLEQADLLECYLQKLPQVIRASVHERTRFAIVEYQGTQADILRAFRQFSYKMEDLPLVSSSRALNRTYEEKLVGMAAAKAVSVLFFPAPLQIAYTVWKASPHLFRGLRCLLRGQIVVEVLDALSIGISPLRGDFSTASSVRFLLGLGELLEEWTHKKSVSDLAQCMSLNINRVCVRLGGLIPLDGVITEGEVMVNQASLTGESIPVPKRTGMTVCAGTVVEEGECVLQVSGQSGGSRYDKIVAMIEQSESLKSTAESRAANLADRLTPYTLAVLSAMREASGFHVTVKGGKYLETAAQADTVVFDKTGILTHACPVVTEVIPFGGQNKADTLRLAACLEEHFPHSMANAVVQAARERGLSHEETRSEVEYIVAHGIVSEVNGQRVIIGSVHFVFEDEHCVVPEGEQERYDSPALSKANVGIAISDGAAIAREIADTMTNLLESS